MPVLKLTPTCKDYLWGGNRLRTDFGIKSDLDPLAEAWVLSCHPDGASYLPDGTTLAEYVAAHPGCLGTDCDKFEQFPILTKLIDAKQNLSVQVHPSNDYALKNEHQYGKTEMLHAICQGIVIAEVQQNSNVTYRVYDYGRVGADGKPRALHIEKALDVTRRTPPQKQDFGGHLAQCEYFTVDVKSGSFNGTADEKSFVSLLITDGAGTLTCGGETACVQKGESYFLPANSGHYTVQGNCQTLVTRV